MAGWRDTAARARFAAHLLASPQRRHLTAWRRSFRPGHLLDERRPWLTYDAIALLDAVDLEGAKVLEFGSGGSTLYWAARGARVVSVEHDPAWHALLAPRLAGLDVDQRLVLPEPAEAPRDPADPAGFASADPAFAHASFRRYVQQAAGERDGSLDLVLVDGRARASCVAAAAPKVKPGGLLVLDNSDRAYYTARNQAALAGFEATVVRGASALNTDWTQTTLYRRVR